MNAQVKERPILFSAPMVRAILDGRKTVTRRVVKHRHPITFLGGRGEENDPVCWGYAFDGPEHHGYAVLARGLNERHDHGRVSIPCPYGEAGDRLWVRETFAPSYFDDGRPGYRADWTERAADVALEPKWKPSIFMRRHESRLTLDVASVRVERLQDITEDDAAREGVTPFPIGPEGDCWTDGKHRTAFNYLWNEINGWSPNSFDSNPWVWRVEFRRIDDARTGAA